MVVKKSSDMGYIYHGKQHLVAKKSGATANYKLKSLAKGEYTVYAWSIGENLTTSREGENEWIEIGTHSQREDGKFKYSRKATAADERFDAIMLIKNNNN